MGLESTLVRSCNIYNKPVCASTSRNVLFLRPSIEYLGHVVDEDGIHPTEEKVKAIKEVRSFLGLINYNNKFLPNLAVTLTPLYSLLNKHQR